MEITIDDLGVQATGDTWLTFRHGVHPESGTELMLGALSYGGMMIVDPIAKRAAQVRMDRPSQGYGVAQAPDGSIWQGSYGAGGTGHPAGLFRWNWDSEHSVMQCELPGSGYFTIDVAADGRVYAPHYVGNTLYRFDPATGELDDLGSFDEFGSTIRNVACATDGWVYLTCHDYSTHCVIAVDPVSGKKSRLKLATRDGHQPFSGILRTADNRVVASLGCWGQANWFECRSGVAYSVPQSDLPMTQTYVRDSPLFETPRATALAFRDGSYVKRVDGDVITLADATGQESSFTIDREESPLRIFSVCGGGGRIWGGTFIPLTLFSHDCATGEVTFYGNPTDTNGEIYNSVWSNGKLFMASYTYATLTRLDPSRPIAMNPTVQSNPGALGRMNSKEGDLWLHRPHGKALAPDGTVYFAAHGSYGCVDSGICRIDPNTEVVTRWLYPQTNFYALCYVPGHDILLVAERRQGESGLRFTSISPVDGAEINSAATIDDIGEVTSWLPDDRDPDCVYGMHPQRGTMFAYSLEQQRIVRELPEMGLGIPLYNMLLFGPDERIWGCTGQCLFAVDRELTTAESLAEYDDHADGKCYRFGMVYGDANSIYFPNGTHLMRVTWD